MRSQYRTLGAVVAAALTTTAPTHAAPQAVTTEVVVSSGLTSPLDLASPPDDERLFVAEQGGRIRIIVDGAVLPTPFLDLTGVVDSGSFTGLRGLTFHPDYATNGYFYVAYDGDAQGGGTDLVIERVSVTADPDVADPTSRVKVLRVFQPQPWHGGGDMAFGPDGMFYTAIGDGQGLGDDVACNAQNGDLLNGKMLRIDVDGGVPYTIPADNPFVGDPNVRDEVWHLGFRHPWRWSFDRATGDVYIADVGNHAREEIDFQAAGAGGLNFGWKVKEGTTCFSTSSCAPGIPPCASPGYVDPIHEYPTAASCSITGGFVYRGARSPALQGTYFFGDYCSGRVWSFRYDGTTLTDFQDRTTELGGPFANLDSFGEDADGELYLIQRGGTVRRIVGPSPFEDFCAGDAGSATPCPCGNVGQTGAGCDNAQGTGGVTVTPTGDPAQSNVVLTGTGFPTGAQPSVVGIRSPNPESPPVAFGDGLRCVAVAGLVRFGATAATGGTSTHPVNHGAGPGTFFYQLWYRNNPGTFCDPAAAFNLSSGVSIVW